MFIADLQNFIRYNGSNSANIKTAVSWLASTDLKSLATGRYEIDGDNVFAMVSQYATKPVEEGKYEYHKKYIDLQYLTRGSEKVYVVDSSTVHLAEPFDDTQDFVLGSSESPAHCIVLGNGLLILLDPKDAHMPCIDCEKTHCQVTKVVVKIAVR
jgi:YhcH/YjgK/YiaL family protein